MTAGNKERPQSEGRYTLPSRAHRDPSPATRLKEWMNKFNLLMRYIKERQQVALQIAILGVLLTPSSTLGTCP